MDGKMNQKCNHTGLVRWVDQSIDSTVLICIDCGTRLCEGPPMLNNEPFYLTPDVRGIFQGLEKHGIIYNAPRRG